MGAQIETLLGVWIFVLGACVGSFLNVLIVRLPADMSIVRPRSQCPKCKAPIAWYDNLPVISWLVLRGRCRACKASFSVRYVLVELATGLLFVAGLVRFGWNWPLVPALVFVSIVIPLIFIDAEHWILPFELTLPGIGLGVLLAVVGGADAFRDAAWGVVGGFLSFRALEILGFYGFKKEALGAGDKFLVAVVGAFLSWRALMGVVFLSSLQGAAFGLTRIALTGRAGPPPEPPPNPAGAEAPAEEPEPEYKMTWDFMKPGLSLWNRLLLMPLSLLLQPIPDELEDELGQEVEWVPGVSNLPFGPWIGLAGLELMFLGPWLAHHLPIAGAQFLFGGGP